MCYSLAWSFLSSRSMSSWNPKTITSGESSEVRTEVRKPALSVVPVSCSGLDASMFQEHDSTVSSRYEQNSDSRSSNFDSAGKIMVSGMTEAFGTRCDRLTLPVVREEAVPTLDAVVSAPRVHPQISLEKQIVFRPAGYRASALQVALTLFIDSTSTSKPRTGEPLRQSADDRSAREAKRSLNGSRTYS